MAMKRILKVMMMEITFPSDENAESWLEVVTREESSCEDRQSHRQAISHPCCCAHHLHLSRYVTISHPIFTISQRYVTISHKIFTISQPPGVPPDFFVGYFSVHGLVQVSRDIHNLFSGELRHHYQPYVSGFGVIFPYFAYFSYFAYF